MRVMLVAATTLVVGACSSPLDQFSLTPSAGQHALVREGVPSLLSAKKHAVYLRPIASRQDANGRPRFVLAMLNRGKKPETFNVSSIAVQTERPRKAKLRVYTHEELAQEVEDERNTQVALEVISGTLGAISAVQSGYSQGKSQPTFNAEKATAALNANTKRTLDDLSGIDKQAQAKLGELEKSIIKDHTLMPGEWHGGVIVIDPPEKAGGAAQYSISLALAGERHTFLVSQQARN
jgi:hypothetical protein